MKTIKQKLHYIKVDFRAVVGCGHSNEYRYERTF